MKKMILIFAVLTIFLGSCRKDFTEQEPQIDTKTMADLNIDDNFNWKTTMDIEVVLTGSTKGVVFINSANGNIYQKGLLYPGVDYKTKITIPTYVTEVSIVYNNQNHLVSIVNNKIENRFN